MSSSNSPCAACKFLRRKCTQECVFAPYFPPDNPQRFFCVHKVFGASNVAKLLNELSASQRDDAVKSLAYEAEARLRDPVYGCVGLISILQHRLRQIQGELNSAKKELAAYMGPQALQPSPPVLPSTGMVPQQHPGPYSPHVYPYNNLPPHQMLIRDPQQHHHPQQHPQIFEAQQFAAAVAAREQQMFRSYDPSHQQQQQQEFLRFNCGFDVGSVSSGGFMSTASAAAEMSPSLALGTFDGPFQIQPQQAEHHHPHPHQLQAQLLLTTSSSPPPQQSPQSQQPHLSQSESEEGRSVGPSSC